MAIGVLKHIGSASCFLGDLLTMHWSAKPYVEQRSFLPPSEPGSWDLKLVSHLVSSKPPFPYLTDCCARPEGPLAGLTFP